MKKINGLVTRVESQSYFVLNSNGEIIRCFLRGKFKKDLIFKKNKLSTYDLVVVGDRVEAELTDDGIGNIVNIFERENYISRKAPIIRGRGVKGERLEQIIAANIDNLFVVTSVYQPDFNNKYLDRILVAGESCKINCSIIINKIDLDETDGITNYWAQQYKNIGYNVFNTCAHKKESTIGVHNLMKNKISLFWGASGVGKSSLLNSIYPGLNLKVGSISKFSNKGKHTTVTSRLLNIDDKTFVVDTPGIRQIEPYGISKQDLSHYYIEFKDYLQDCKFNTCIHAHEPGCAVEKAVIDEKISIERYDSYLSLLESVDNDFTF